MSTEVRPGQVWADNDSRSAGRQIRVDRIDGGVAVCTIVANTDDVQARIDGKGPSWYRQQDRRGKPTRIALRRFKPTNTGYFLVSDATPETAPEPAERLRGGGV